MCAGCFTHLLADARLRDEVATCPNCRIEINKNTSTRNLAVEKVRLSSLVCLATNRLNWISILRLLMNSHPSVSIVVASSLATRLLIMKRNFVKNGKTIIYKTKL